MNKTPDYYSHPSGIECEDISKYLSGGLAQAFQYVWRAGNKPDNDMIQDLNKALDWIDIDQKEPEFIMAAEARLKTYRKSPAFLPALTIAGRL